MRGGLGGRNKTHSPIAVANLMLLDEEFKKETDLLNSLARCEIRPL